MVSCDHILSLIYILNLKLFLFFYIVIPQTKYQVSIHLCDQVIGESWLWETLEFNKLMFNDNGDWLSSNNDWWTPELLRRLKYI